MRCRLAFSILGGVPGRLINGRFFAMRFSIEHRLECFRSFFRTEAIWFSRRTAIVARTRYREEKEYEIAAFSYEYSLNLCRGWKE